MFYNFNLHICCLFCTCFRFSLCQVLIESSFPPSPFFPQGTTWERDRQGRGNDRQKGATVKRGEWRWDNRGEGMNREEGMTGDRSKGKPGKRWEHSEQGDDNLKCIALRCFGELSHTKLYTFVFSLQICRYQLHSNSWSNSCFITSTVQILANQNNS